MSEEINVFPTHARVGKLGSCLRNPSQPHLLSTVWERWEDKPLPADNAAEAGKGLGCLKRQKAQEDDPKMLANSNNKT